MSPECFGCPISNAMKAGRVCCKDASVFHSINDYIIYWIVFVHEILYCPRCSFGMHIKKEVAICHLLGGGRHGGLPELKEVVSAACTESKEVHWSLGSEKKLSKDGADHKPWGHSWLHKIKILITSMERNWV